MKPVRQKKPKLTARERGYVSRSEAAAMLRSCANEIEQGRPADNWAELVKFSLQIWYAKDDETATPITGENQ